MKVSNVNIHRSPDMVLGDLFFAIGGGLARPGTRVDEYFDAFLDCLNRLDRDGVYTFLDPKSQAFVRLQRNGEEVLVQSDGANPLPDGSDKMKYTKFRAGILAALDLYRNQLAEAGPTHPENRRFLARLERACCPGSWGG
jgi:hypothetical protein